MMRSMRASHPGHGTASSRESCAAFGMDGVRRRCVTRLRRAAICSPSIFRPAEETIRTSCPTMWCGSGDGLLAGVREKLVHAEALRIDVQNADDRALAQEGGIGREIDRDRRMHALAL